MSHGAFALVAVYSLTCPDTDAIMGEGSHVINRFDTRSAADAEASRLNEFDDDSGYVKVVMKPYTKGEDEPVRPLYSALELYNDYRAQQRDLGAPAWAL